MAVLVIYSSTILVFCHVRSSTNQKQCCLFVFFYFPGRPVTVYIDVYIVDIGEISVTNMVRFVFMYFTVMKAEKLNAEAIKTLRDDTQHILGTHEHG